MRIDLLLSALLIGAACASPATPEGGTTPPGGGAPATPGEPAPEPGPAPEPDPGGGGADPRSEAVPSSHPQYERVEGTSFQNGCSGDGQCFVGGCSSEVCSAEEGVSSTCEAPAAGWPTTGATCGCVRGQCIWYKAGTGPGPDSSSGSNSGSGSGAASAAAQGKPCSAGGTCASGLTCVKYHGVAGTRGPEMTSCEIRCPGGGGCPAGQICLTIADGPGEVCRADG
jgi:hypothetical protein